MAVENDPDDVGLAEDGLLLGEAVIFKGDEDACGTPPTPVAVATYVPDGAASDVAKTNSQHRIERTSYFGKAYLGNYQTRYQQR